MGSINIVEEGLRALVLTPLKRPAVGPDDDPTEELVSWAITLYVYSSIVHIRTVLAGIIALQDMANIPSGNVLSRHVFEWTAHACYVAQASRALIPAKRWKDAFDLFHQVDTGNLWIKKHGHKYDAKLFSEEILKPIRIGKLMSAYAEYQQKEYGKTVADDSYGFLSEYSHPNGACLHQYREIVGAEVHFLAPPLSSTFGGINGFIVEWTLFMRELLAFSKEHTVRHKLVEILAAVAKLRRN